MLTEIQKREQELLNWFPTNRHLALAFSGGVDSAVVASAARRALRSKDGLLRSFFFVSPTSGRQTENETCRLAQEIGISLTVLQGTELNDPSFIQNDSERCYHCKKRRFTQLKVLMENETPDGLLLEGSNADDQQDYRPGRRALQELGFRSPLAELGFVKEEVRSLARYWSLSVADKPSEPCLATRIAYGLTITEEELRRIGQAEEILHTEGFPLVRVRLDAPDTVRIEVPEKDLSRLIQSPLRSELVTRLRALGWSFLSLDLEGFRSGKMNRILEKRGLK